MSDRDISKFDPKQFGRELRELRLLHRLTLKKASVILGVDVSRLSALERGRINEDGERIPLSDEELLRSLPMFPHKNNGTRLSPEELDKLIDDLRNM